MADLFVSSKLTLARAKHHIRDLERQVQPFISKDAWTYVVEKDSDGVTNLHKVRFNRRLAPEVLGVLFDAANNLRAALDQAGYAAAIASGKVEPKRTHFPFASSAAELPNVIARKSKDLPPEILSLFCAFKPYKRGNRTLWALNKLCNTKKHCSLVPLQLGRMRLSYGASCETGLGGIDQNFIARWDPERYEIILMRAAPEVRFTSDIGFTFTVTIKSIEVLRDKPVVEVLDTIAGKVERILMATEAESRRIGLIP